MRLAWKAPVFLAFAGLPLLVHFALRDSLGANALAGLAHAGAYLALLWYFGRTLRPGREPLITRIARRIHGSVTPDMECFTRRLTVAWCAFFAGQVLVSGLLLAFAPHDIWSMFVNVLDLPLLALMFVAQQAYRALCFPLVPPVSIARILTAFAEVTSRAPCPRPCRCSRATPPAGCSPGALAAPSASMSSAATCAASRPPCRSGTMCSIAARTATASPWGSLLRSCAVR